MTDRKELIRQKMEEARALLLGAVADLDDNMAVASTENPEWRVRDILAHLAMAEPGLLSTVQRFLAGTDLPPGFDLDRWNRSQVKKRANQNIESLVLSLQTSREQAWLLLDSLSAENLDVVGTHPTGLTTTVEGLFLTIANHELDHGNEIRTALDLPVTEQADWHQVMQAQQEDQ